MSGPARKPRNELNPRGGQFYQRDDGPDPVTGEPVCPDWMPAIGVQEWERATADMRERGFLSGSYQTALEDYCLAYAEWRSSLIVLGREGTVIERETKYGSYPTHHPMVKQRDDARKKMVDAMRQFGMTPASTRKLSVGKRKGPKPIAGRDQGLGVVG